MTMMGCVVLLGRTERDLKGRDGRPADDRAIGPGGGMSNSPAPASRVEGPQRLEDGSRPSSRGLTNGAVPSAPSGLETQVDLVNGNPARDGMARKGRPRWWGRSARRGRAERESLLERARQPLPGTAGQGPTDERD